LGFLSFINVNQVKINNISDKTILFLGCLVLILHDGLRWETGTDWQAYLYQFKSVRHPEVESWLKVEPGYFYLVKVFNLFSENYTLFLIIHAIIIYSILFYVMNEMSPYPVLSIFFYYVTFIGVLGMNRQLLAIAICLISVKYLAENRIIKFIIIVFIAMIFHISSAIFFLLLLFRKNFKLETYFIFIIIAIIIRYTDSIKYFLNAIAPILGDFAKTKLLTYLNDSNKNYSFLSYLFGLMRRIPIFMLFIIYRRKFDNDKYFPILINSYFLTIMLCLMFYGQIQIFIARAGFYFSISECFLIARVFTFVSKRSKYIVFILIFIYACLNFLNSIKSYPDLFIPYKGIYINSEYLRVLY